MFHPIESLESRRLFAGGALDTAFATGGAATVSFRTASATDSVTPKQVLTDAAGHIYIVATAASTLQVRRLTADGAVDNAWGRHGLLVFVRKTGNGVNEARLDHAGRLDVLVDNAISRYTTAGTLDTTFGTNGTVSLAGTFTDVNDFAVDSGDRIYATGGVPTRTRYLERAAVARLISRGRFDRTFQSKGVYTLPLSQSDSGNETQSSGSYVRVLADDSVVVAGTVGFGTQNDSLLPLRTGVRATKLTAAGVPDKTYGRSGTTVALPLVNHDDEDYSLDLLGIRASGAVGLDAISEGGVGGVGESIEEIQPDGTYYGFNNDGIEYADESSNYDAAPNAAAFTTLSDGRDLATLGDTGVSVLTAGGGYDHAFNNGHAIKLAAGRVNAVGVAATGTADDKILTAKAGAARAEVIVNRFLTTGSGTSPIEPGPAALPVAGGRKLTMPATSFQFNAVYSARAGETIDVSGLGGTELRLFAPDGRHRVPRLIGTQTNDNGQSVIATYRVTDPGGEAWDASDNGTYTVRLIGGVVRISDGTTIEGQNIGTLTVKIA